MISAQRWSTLGSSENTSPIEFRAKNSEVETAAAVTADYIRPAEALFAVLYFPWKAPEHDLSANLQRYYSWASQQ